MDYLDIITKRFNLARTNQTGWFVKFARWYALYRNYQYRKNYQGRADLFVPASFWTVESYVPRLNRSVRTIKAKATLQKDHKNEKSITELLEYQRGQINWENIQKNWIRGAGIYGSYALKISWNSEADLPNPELLDIMDVFYDPAAERVEKARWFIHRTQRHYDDLVADKKMGYKNLDKIMPKGSPPYDEGFKQQRRSILSVAQRPFNSDAKMVDIYEFWGWISQDGEPEKNMLITVANKNTVIREQENPMVNLLPKGVFPNSLPIVMLYDTDTPHELYGIGEIEPIEKLQEELNDTRNQRMDNVNLVINRQYEVIRSADISEEDFISLPGKVYYSNIPNGIRALDTPDVTASSLEEEKLIKEDIQQTTTGTANVDIPQVNKSETATGVMAVQEAGDTRTEYKVINLKDALKQAWRIILALDQELITKDYVIRLEGSEGTIWKTLTPKEIQGEFEIDIEVESQQNRLVKKQEAMQLFQLALKTPNANVPLAYTDLLELFDKQNPEEYILPPPPPTPPTPAVSISLRGELSPAEVDEFSKRAGADPKAADPLLRPENRLLMKAAGGFKEPLLPDEQKVLNESQTAAPAKGVNAP